MPATEEVWRNLRKVHVWFAASAVALFAATWLMMSRDFDDEWRPIQRVAQKLQVQQLQQEFQGLETTEFEAQQRALQERLTQAEERQKENLGSVSEVQGRLDAVDGQLQKLTRDVKFQRAQRDKARADLDIAVRDGTLTREGLRPWQTTFDLEQKKVDDMETALQKLQVDFDKIKAEQTALTKAQDDAKAAQKKHAADLNRLTKVMEQLHPTNPLARFKRWIMEQPIIEGFNGPYKIQQLWLPDLTVGLGGMTEVARFDRCITCHVNIDRTAAGNIPSFPHDPQGVTMVTAEKFLTEPKERTHADGSPKGYGHPFSTHPHPELYLSSTSPHPMQKFGCTGCHEGQGSGTSFQNASHTPSSPDIGEKWRKEYGYFNNHFWEYPMYPGRLAEAACLKCHHQVVELGEHPKFGASAPKVFRGYELVRQYGCFGCHEINGYTAGKAIGPDMRLEPQTEDEAERIAADPGAVAGTMRKVGPGLRHFASKTNAAWAENWVEEPKRFRPETRMPQFFHLSNQKDDEGAALQPVEIAGVVAYLFAKSESMDLVEWAADYVPDAERGKKLFSQRGCLGCHSHGDFPGIKSDFGPNLTNVHQKLSSAKWLYNWIREPSRHSSRTRMPNLYLEPETVQGKTIDPAADITAYLLWQRDAAGQLVLDDAGKPQADAVGPGRFEPVRWEGEGLNSLVRLFLKKTLGSEKADAALAAKAYPEKEAASVRSAAIQPDEIELVNGPITDETMLQYVGRRTISRYGCYGCHDIPGFEKARPIGTGLQDWGRKDPTKLALEHIEEYLHHHGEPDGSSTAQRAERAFRGGVNGTLTPEEQETEGAAGFFFGQLATHGRAGFLWQKLRDPRSYDYKKIETKGWDERLRMPKFPFSEQDIEAVATFVLGLVAEPPAEKYVYRPQGPAKARIQGEKLIAKYNCAGCHTLELPEIISAPEDLTPDELTAADHPEALELLLKLKPPRDGRTARKLPSGEAAISFHGQLYQGPDPDEDLEDQRYYYDLWETLQVGDDKSQLLFPGRRMEVAVTKLLETRPGRGGAFSEWLVEDSMKADREVNRDKARQMAPPPLYLEGRKVQTPWLYSFLKNPMRIRYTTVMRMPQFNLSNDEAQALADYFAAVDGASFPYQEVPQREPSYLSTRQRELDQATPGHDYLKEAWKVITIPPPTGLCAGCHSVGGREFVAGDPTKVVRGPNLEGVYNRLRPEWVELWIYKPKWITPFTAMPQNFPRDKPQFPELFGGDGQKQSIAARDALMNYLRMLEREGTVTATAPVAGPADPPPAQEGTND
ncbi:MAG: hypothetical protein ACKV0T_13920 [Planctomycetales bacterium]